jgi:carboxyl-terminal processing protease
MRSEKRGALLVAIVLVASAILGGIYGPSMRATAAGASDLQDSVKTFTKVLTVVQQNYAIPIDADKAVYDGAIPGMLRTLDPHSIFFDAKQFALMREEQEGRYYGVGMYIVPRPDGRVQVVSAFVGSPAYKAGLKPGDVLVKIDDKPVAGKPNTDIVDMLKGPAGTAVHITAMREGTPDPIAFSVTRADIPKHDVDPPLMIRPGIGYIYVRSFQSQDTATDFADDLQKLAGQNLTGLVIDLRDNGGGLVNSAIGIADDILDKNQLIVSQRGRVSPEHRYYATHGNQGVRVPIVALVNGNTASASEIVSGAIQDHDRGLILGERTFGKGLIQAGRPLSEGTGLALSVAQYYTPSGRWIQRDYKTVSLFEYEFNHNTSIHETEIKLTDSGRKVFGGGGITPDDDYTPPKLNAFQQMLQSYNADVLVFAGNAPNQDNAVGDFTIYFLGTHPMIAKNFVVDDGVIRQFRAFLTKCNIKYTDQDIADNLDWIKLHIKREVFTSVFGQLEGYRVEAEGDPEILKGAELIPQARALYENARRIIAERTSPSLNRPM